MFADFILQVFTHGNDMFAYTTTLLLLLPFNGPLDFVWDYPGQPVPEK